MSSRHVAASAAVAVGAGVALLTIVLFQLRQAAWKRHNYDESVPKDACQHERRVTLEEVLKDGELTVKPIGTVRSIYRLCVGTPRQGLLAPNARGRLELEVSPDAVLELDGFSHIWVVFIFHLNTVSKNGKQVPMKIAPPALGGRKVGVLATRSPHRMNPIGITLCKLESVSLPSKHSPKTILHVSGLDLVDGTPILDIKPYVPDYDSVDASDDQVTYLPRWVSGGLATRRPVHIQSKAVEELEAILTRQPQALDFYGTHCGDKTMEDTLKSITHCIAEVLSIDVRSAWQTNKARDKKFQAERAGRVRDVMDAILPQDESEQCTQQLDNLLIYYTVHVPEQHSRSASEGSGAEDVVHVSSIQLLTGGISKNADEADGLDKADDKLAVSSDSSNGNVPVAQEESSPTSAAPPTDADYQSLKSYWAKAASKNTPTGLLPEGCSGRRRQSQKFFVFSAKPVMTPQRITPTQQQAKSYGSEKGAPVAPMEESDVVGEDESKVVLVPSTLSATKSGGDPDHPVEDNNKTQADSAKVQEVSTDSCVEGIKQDDVDIVKLKESVRLED